MYISEVLVCSLAVMNTTGWGAGWGIKVYLTYGLQSNTEGSQGRKPELGTEAETGEGFCLLAYSQVNVQLPS